ncbi:MAG: hypothetical protein ACREFW_06405 [Rhizomicrobium sp.]
MLIPVSRLLGTLVVAFGMVLGGVAPTWAGMGNPDHGLSAHTAVPCMQMNMGTADGKKMPGKEMPCGSDCGCCIAGTCAAPAAPGQSTLVELLVHDTSPSINNSLVLGGITFPPAIRPPIPQA